MSSGLHLRVFERLEDFRQAAPQWEDLVLHSPTATIFSSWEWLGAWWNAFGSGYQAHILGFFDDAGDLVGVCPLYFAPLTLIGGQRLRVLKLIGDGTWDSDNLGIPARRGWEERVAQSLLEYLRACPADWDICELNTLTPHSAVGTHLRKRLTGSETWNCYVYHQPHSMVSLGGSWERFLSQMKERTNLLYYTRRLEKALQPRLYRCESESELPGFLERFFAIHQKRWTELGHDKGTFALPARRDFYHQMSASFLRRGWLRFYLLDSKDVTVAGSYNFRFRDTVYGLQSGFHPDYAKYRPGFVMKGYVIRKSVEEGAGTYDFLGGFDENKERWGVKPASYMDIRFARAFSRGSAYLSARHHGLAAKERLRGALPPAIWRALKAAYRTVRNDSTPA